MGTKKRHIVIPDTQVKPGVPLDHFTAAGNYIADKKPDVVVHIGDLADMHSLSSYDEGKKCYEGRTYKQDIEAAHEAQELLFAPIRREQQRYNKNHKHKWNPKFVLTLGNHEQRIARAIELDRKLEGTIQYADLGYQQFGWRTYDYLQPVNIDGIMYCHYFTSGDMGRPVASARALINKKHMSCTMGHNPKTEIDMSQVRGDGKPIIGLFAGVFYQHEEEYLGPQGNPKHRQIWLKNEVDDGFYYICPVSLNYLLKEYK